MLKRVAFVSVVFILSGSNVVWCQYLPLVPTGDLSTKLELVADGLPVTEYETSTGGFLYFGATDFEAVPGATRTSAVATHPGRVLMLASNGEVAAQPLIDLKDPASPTFSSWFFNSNVLGFTAIEFHPDFANQGTQGYGKFYTLESEARSAPYPPDFVSTVVPADNHDGVLYEYTLTDHQTLSCDNVCANSKRPLFRVQQPGISHNMGDLAFDASGLLYVTVGDGSFTSSTEDPIISQNAAMLDNAFGKILRIDPLGNNSDNGNYGIPGDNPFVDGPGGNVDEIYAYGLRNPYRIDFDEETGSLYAADVGQRHIESVDLIVKGANYGWDHKEGSFIYDRYDQGNLMIDEDLDMNGIPDLADSLGLTDPILEYGHNTGPSIIGGVLYRGSLFPELQGKYVFADYTGSLFHGDPATGEIVEFRYDFSGDPLISFIYSVNEDSDGEIFVVGLIRDGPNSNGAVMRMGRSPSSPDVNDDLALDCSDVDALVQAIVDQKNGLDVELSLFDLTADGKVDNEDLDAWLVAAGVVHSASGNPLLAGDADLNGVVDGRDFVIWNGAKFTETAAWCQGDFNADGVVDGRDYVVWNGNKFQVAAAVPEPCLGLVWIGVLMGAVVRRQLHPNSSPDSI